LTTKAALDWRRSKIIELRSRGLSQVEIAQELQVSKSAITLDMQYLRKRAKDEITKYTTEHLPSQYQICLVALDSILKRTFDMIERSDDERIKLQAMELFKDTHTTKLELLSNATCIDNALEFIRSKQKQQHASSQEEKESIKATTDSTTITTTDEDKSAVF